jgi:succinoglycan biosynthesis transport protein ExoP
MTPTQNYLTVSRRALDVEDYIDILRRHSSWILGPLFAGLVISCVIAFFLPNTYVSAAVLRITPPQISEALVPSTVTQQMNDRIAQMQTQILSRTSLSELIQKPTLQLYPRERSSGPLEDVIETMRNRDVHINIVNLAGASGRPATAFTISFQYPDRFKAQAVVQELTTRFMESMINVTGLQGKVTQEFLKDEITQAKADLTRLDNELVNFRVQNQGHLPEDLQLNMQKLNMLQQRYGAVNDALTRISEDKLTMDTNLQTLRAQRDALQAIATSTIEQGGTRSNERLARLKQEVMDMETQLTQALQFYKETYPDIRSAKTMIELKKKERDKLQAEEDAEAAKPKQAGKIISSPMVRERMIDNQGMIDNVMTAMRNKETERLERIKDQDQITKQIQVIENQIASSPPNAQKYASMLREYNMAEQHYQDMSRKDVAATTYDNVGKKKAGENLEVLDTASLPETPTSPNRWLYCGIGTGVGLMIGVFLTGIKEVKDTSLKNLKDVRAYTQLPILSSIPLLENDLLVRRKRRLAYVGWSAAVIVGIIAMSGSMYYHYFLTS